MAKYVHPNMIIDSSAAFLKNVTFDSSVYFQGVTHINAPAAVSSQTPFALVLESGSGTDLQVKSVQLGTMAKETAATWDASLSAIRTDIGHLETSVGALDTLTQSHTTQLGIHNASIGVLTSLTAVHDSSLGFLNAYRLIQDASIAAVGGAWKPYVDGSLATRDSSIIALFAKNAAQDASIVRIDASLNDTIELFDVIDASFQALWDYNAIQDTSIAALEAATPNVANGLQILSDGSIGLGGQLMEDTTIDASNYVFQVGAGDFNWGNQEYSSISIRSSQVYMDSGDSTARGRIRLDSAGGFELDFNNSVIIDNGDGKGLVYNQDYSATFQPRSLVTKQYVDGQKGAGNGLKILSDGSIGLGGTLSEPTTITANSTNTLSLAGLVTSVDNTPFALVQESAGGPIRTRELGSMAWATTTDYTLKSLFDSSITAIWTKFGYVDTSLGILNNWNVSQDASIVTLRNTTLSALQTANNGLTASDTSVALGGTLTHDTNIDTDQYYLSVTGDMRVIGDLTVDGSVTYINSVNLNVSDNIITINYGETGNGVTKLNAGLIIDRGSSTNYFFGFNETTDTFRIGMQDEESGLPIGTQAVATREDTPVSWGVGFWNGTAFRIDTSAGFTFEPGVGLSLPIATVDNNEITSLMIDSNGLVVSRDLGTMAFATATDYVLQSLFDTSIAAIWTKLGSVDTSISGLDTLTQTHTSQIAQITTDIADLSTNKLDAVANLNVVGDASIFAYETGTTAYLKKLVAGAGVVVTEDVSTITISGDTASGVYKYAGTFTADGSTSMSIPAGTHHLGTGPLSVTVYEGTDQVWVDVDCDATGNITLEWTEAALSGTCKYIIMG